MKSDFNCLGLSDTCNCTPLSLAYMTDVFIPLQVTVIGNGIFDNRDHGLFVKNQATVEENDIVGNQRSALQLERNSNVIVSLFIARVLYSQKHIHQVLVLF